RPDAGRVRFRGVDITDVPAHQRAAAGIARAFQNVGLIRGATVRTNLLAAGHLSARYTAAAGVLGLPATYLEERRLSRRGETLAAGSPDEVRSRPEVVRAYLGEETESWLLGGESVREPLVEVSGLEVSYPAAGHHRRAPVLRDVSFEVLDGERLVLLGLN